MKNHKGEQKAKKPQPQSEAVMQEIKKIYGDRFVAGKTKARQVLKPKDIDKIADSVAQKIESGHVFYRKAVPARPILFKYVKTVIFNLIKKNKNFNGGVNYEPVPRKSKNDAREQNRRGHGNADTSPVQAGKKPGPAAPKKLKEKPAESFSTVIYQDEAPSILKRFQE